MNFRGDEGAYLGMPGNDDAFMYDLLGITADHARDGQPAPGEHRAGVAAAQGAAPGDQQRPLAAWNATRPPFVEAEAQQRVGLPGQRHRRIGVRACTPAAQAALDAMNGSSRPSYPNLFVETCTHYLTLSNESDCGTYGKVNPPLRDPADVEALWAGVANGDVDTVGSDHNARHRTAKEKDIWDGIRGVPRPGAMLPLTLDRGTAAAGSTWPGWWT